MQPFRIESSLPPQAFRTHMLKQPLRTHWRKATCVEVDCPRYLRGWTTVLGMNDRDGQNAAAWIRTMSGLHFTEKVTGPFEITFEFPAGQLCPHSNPAHPKCHRAPIGRPPVMLVRGGDHRIDPDARTVVFDRAEDWRDDLGEKLEDWRDRKQRG